MCASISRFIRQRGFQNVVFASSCGDIVKWLQPDWVVVLNQDQPAKLYVNPAIGKPSEAFRPVVNMSYKLEANEGDMMAQYEHTWALKLAEVCVCVYLYVCVCVCVCVLRICRISLRRMRVT